MAVCPQSSSLHYSVLYSVSVQSMKITVNEEMVYLGRGELRVLPELTNVDTN